MILYNISFFMAHHIVNKKPKGKVKKKVFLCDKQKNGIIKEKAVTRLILKP